MSDVIANGSKLVDDTGSHIRRLRREVETLLRDAMTPAIADAFERAASAARSANNAARENSETVADKVRGRPLISIMSAAFVGFVLGRAWR